MEITLPTEDVSPCAHMTRLDLDMLVWVGKHGLEPVEPSEAEFSARIKHTMVSVDLLVGKSDMVMRGYVRGLASHQPS